MRVRSLLAVLAVVAACESSSTSDGTRRDGAAGAGETGGTTPAGGTSGTGGTSASGGVSATGGTSATGGATGTAGASATGGATGTGGASLAGGATGKGGATGSGGATTAGGATGSGGRTNPGRDAGPEVGAGQDSAAGGTAGGGAGGGGGGGSDGAGPDAGSEAGAEAGRDVALDVARDGGADTGFWKPVPVPDGGTCPFKGNVSYTLRASSDATADQQIKAAMDLAMFYYNCYSNLSRALNVYYEPSVQTADGNSNGTIRFGPAEYRNARVAMHETGHTFGIGTASNWNSFINKSSSGSGPWTGTNGIAQRDALLPDHWQDTQRVLTADGHCFWPYGLSQPHDYVNEDDLIGHCMMVMAIQKDLGM
jgi:hypothetical protein